MPRPSALPAPTDLAKEVSLYRRQLIVREAALLFFERGYPATTMDDIAARLNVTKPVLYTQFPSKTALLFEVCQGGMTELHAAIDQLADLDIDPAEKLRRIVATTVRTLMDKQPEVAIFAREAKHLPAAQVAAIHRTQKAFDAKLARILEQGVASGAFAVTDAGLATLAITGMVSWMFSWYGRQKRLTDDQICDGFVEMALRMVARPTS